MPPPLNLGKDITMTEERKRLYEKYRKLGMTEKQIEEIKRFDDEIEKNDREYHDHTVSIEDAVKEQKINQKLHRHGGSANGF